MSEIVRMEADARVVSEVKRATRISDRLHASSSLLVRLIPLIALLVIWEIGAGRFLDTLYYGQPSSILGRLWQIGSWDGLNHIRVSLVEMLAGFALGSVLGALIGYLLGARENLGEILEPYIIAFYSIPLIALAPVFIFWLGLGIFSKVLIVTLLVFFTVFYLVYLGVKRVSKEHVNLARLMGASESQVVWRVVIPSVFPYMILGMRMGLPKAAIGVIIGEFVGSKEGLGHYIFRSANQLDPTGVFAGIIIIVLATMVINGLFARAESRVLTWTKFEQRMAED